MQPILIAKTPRAGEYNYRYLVPVQHGCAETEIYAIAQRATGRVCGPDFLGAYRQVSQLKGGRTGEEAIILAGIDTAALGERQKVILALLEDLLVDLERLVTVEIDWTQLASERMLIDCETLNDWMRQLKERLAAEYRSDASLPIYVPPAPISPSQNRQMISPSPRTPAVPQRQPYGLMASIGLICLIVGGIVGWSAGSKPSETPDSSRSKETELQERNTELQERNTELQERNTELQELKTELQELKTELQESNTELQESNTELQELKTELQELKTELKTELQEYKTAFARLCKNEKIELLNEELQNFCHDNK